MWKYFCLYSASNIKINFIFTFVGCIHNGTLYGSGSAMQTSSLCEYCYCINGKEHCVKPKCLLPVEGCKALYAPHSCCPTHYKCRGDDHKTTRIPSTTITTPKINVDKKLGKMIDQSILKKLNAY